jgi:hypothetical protein
MCDELLQMHNLYDNLGVGTSRNALCMRDNLERHTTTNARFFMVVWEEALSQMHDLYGNLEGRTITNARFV